MSKIVKIVKPTGKRSVRWNTPRGKLIGWKWAYGAERGYSGAVLIKLEIPARAHVICGCWHSSSKRRKRRASEARVLAMWKIAPPYIFDKPYRVGRPYKGVARSWLQSGFKYKIGETVLPGRFSFNVLQGCAGGIHFFLMRSRAVAGEIG